MKIIRFQLKRLVVVIFIIIVLFALHSVWNNEKISFDCVMSTDTEKKLDNLLDEIQKALVDLKLTYFLCYNSLWGALKFKKSLPWHTELELCVLNKELTAVDEGILNRIFKSHSLVIIYNSAGGFYKVNKFEENVPTATLTVFEEDQLTHQMRRVGWIHRVLPPNSCEELNCFPPELISEPMPTIMFGTNKVPVPRDSIEILKYLFPNSWWEDITPFHCRTSTERQII
ncbi:uncharacterized protein [Parasteatoda tepidariorum]|uniref:Uncharacterized protein n=1 Tax=Parasteatoda tepidariorum TaxID=114398 RepID=A0A2L2Y0V0_PARTP|nr:uncharacterized protein LOC107443715 [Parasteatoda tepidariorum]